MEYTIVSGENKKRFEAEINQYINSSWELYGAPVVIISTMGSIVYHQALTRRIRH